MRWLDGVIDLMGMSLSKLQYLLEDWEGWGRIGEDGEGWGRMGKDGMLQCMVLSDTTE